MIDQYDVLLKVLRFKRRRDRLPTTLAVSWRGRIALVSDPLAEANGWYDRGIPTYGPEKYMGLVLLVALTVTDDFLEVY